MVRKKTQREIEQERASQEFLKEREKAKFQFMSQGATEKQAGRLEVQQRESRELPFLHEQQRKQDEQQRKQKLEVKEQEIIKKEGAEVQPEKISLDPIEFSLEKETPFGASFSAILLSAGLSPNRAEALQELHTQTQTLPLEQRETFFQLGSKRLIEKEILQKRLTFDEQAGVQIEAIPGIGSLARKYARTIQTPSKQVDDIRALILDFDEQITFAQDISIDNSSLAFDNLDSIESQILKLESKIQQLIIISAELRANPEEIDKIENEILIRRQKIFSTRRSIAKALAAQQTI